MTHDIADLLMLVALAPMMLTMVVLLSPVAFVALSAWRGGRDRASGAAEVAGPAVSVMTLTMPAPFATSRAA